MALFDRDRRQSGAAQRRVYAAFEMAYTVVDFAAAISFLVGSVMFLFEEWQTPGTWLFIVGSALFALKPTIRLVRELRLAAMGDSEDLAERL